MTIVHKNKVTNVNKTGNVAVENLSVRLPEEVPTANSYSALDSNKSTVSDSVSDSTPEETEYTWKDAVSEKSNSTNDSDYDDMPALVDCSNDSTDDDMPPLIDENNELVQSDESSDQTQDNTSDESDETSDENTYVSEQDEDFVSEKTSDEETSDDDIIVAHTQYRRVRTNKKCKDGIPYAIQLAFFFFALAQFMQLVFLVCKSVPHRHCISDPF